MCIIYCRSRCCKNWLRRPNNKPLYINPCFIKRCCSPIYHICWGTNWSACIYANGLPDAQLFGSVMFIVIWVAAEMDVSSRNAILFNSLLILIYFLLAFVDVILGRCEGCCPGRAALPWGSMQPYIHYNDNKNKTRKKIKKRRHWCELATKSK